MTNDEIRKHIREQGRELRGRVGLALSDPRLPIEILEPMVNAEALREFAGFLLTEAALRVRRVEPCAAHSEADGEITRDRCEAVIHDMRKALTRTAHAAHAEPPSNQTGPQADEGLEEEV